MREWSDSNIHSSGRPSKDHVIGGLFIGCVGGVASAFTEKMYLVGFGLGCSMAFGRVITKMDKIEDLGANCVGMGVVAMTYTVISGYCAKKIVEVVCEKDGKDGEDGEDGKK